MGDAATGGLPFHCGAAGVFHTNAAFSPPQLGDGTGHRFWQEDWSGLGRLQDLFPRLYALALVPGATVRIQWSDAWCLALPQALSDQRLADLLTLQSWLASMRLTNRVRDAWVWRHSRFSVRAAYRTLCGQEPPEDFQIVCRCQLVWKQRLPLEIRLFGWLLIRRRLMTRALRHRQNPKAPVECPLCHVAQEDCCHLFLQCPLVQAAWRAAGGGHLVTTSDEEFWISVSGGTFRQEAEGRRIFATLWSVRLHCNQVIFRGRPPADKEIVHDARGFALSWHQGGTSPLLHVPM